MHEDHRRLRRLRGKAPIEPAEPFGVELAPVFSRDDRVEPDEAHRPALDGIVEKTPLARQLAAIGKDAQQLHPVVMISRNEKDRHRQRRKEPALLAIFLGRAVIDEIAGAITISGKRGGASWRATAARRQALVSTLR